MGDPVYDENKDGDELHSVGHETLVARKSLLAPKSDLEDDQLRTNIFHTICTVTFKVYKMIINSGSCKNMVSEEVVQKLQLKIDCHPRAMR